MIVKLDNPLEACDLKFEGLAPGQFEGYLSVFGRTDSYGDTIVRGAFKDTLKARKRPVPMFFGHSMGRPIGVWKNMHEDDVGLRVRGELTPGNTDAQNIHASMKHGAVSGLSIGFRMGKDDWEPKEDGNGRVIKRVQLVEGSVVTMPAEDEARISEVRMDLDDLTELKDAERYLREAGLSRSTAKAFLGRLNGMLRREAAPGEQKRREDRTESVLALLDKYSF
jgi:uncharacterized protein